MKKDKKIIPISNYVKLVLIIIVTIVGAFILRDRYMAQEKYEKGIPVIRDYINSEINSSEVYHYIRENDDVLLYIGVSDNNNCRSLEEDLKNTITKNGLENRITYLNLTDEKKKDSFIKEFNKYFDTKLLGYPSFVLFEGEEVKEILTVKTGDSLSIDTVKEFFKRNNISSDYD